MVVIYLITTVCTELLSFKSSEAKPIATCSPKRWEFAEKRSGAVKGRSYYIFLQSEIQWFTEDNNLFYNNNQNTHQMVWILWRW